MSSFNLQKTYTIRTIKGVFWHVLSYTISLPLAYLARILYARELPKEEVGFFYTLYDFIAILAQIFLTVFNSIGKIFFFYVYNSYFRCY